MVIRKYRPCDCKELSELFYNTVHTVNARDYTIEQLDVWATGKIDLEKWNQSFQEHYSIVAVHENVVTHASITARPFFEKRGYQVIKEQQVERQGIFLTNFVMEKDRYYGRKKERDFKSPNTGYHGNQENRI